MKKSFHISFISPLILLFIICTGFANGTRNNISVDSSKNQIGLKASDGIQQHDIVFMASVDENDADADKTFLDSSFILFIKYMVFWGSDSNSETALNSASELKHLYHLPKYLLFHNLKIRLSTFIV